MGPTKDDRSPEEIQLGETASGGEGSEETSRGDSAVIHTADSFDVDLVKWSLVTLATLSLLYTLYFARELLFPITLAVVLNLVLKPLIIRASRLGVPAAASTSIVMVGLIALSAFLVVSLQSPAQRWIEQAPGALQVAAEKLQFVQDVADKISEATEEVDRMADFSGGGNGMFNIEVKEKESVTGKIFYTSTGFLTGAMIFVVLLFFLLAAGDRMLEKIVAAMPTWKDKRRVVELVREVQRKISSYLATITFINIALGVVIGLGLWAIGLPNPVLWGVMAALLNFVPFVGLVAGAAIVFGVALLTDGFTLAESLAAPAIYLGANALEANFLTPALLGRSISLNPVVVIVAIFVWGWLWGIGGVVLAVPLTVAVKIACDNSERFRAVGDFLAE